MKEGTHPTYFTDALIICGTCGTQWRTGSTKKELHVDLCSNCHPFYTGQQRIVDTAGQVERFTKRLQAHESITPVAEGKPTKKERRALQRAMRSGQLQEPEAEATAPEAPAAEAPTAEATAAPEAGTPAGTAEARPAPRERRPRPPREARRPREPREPRGERPNRGPVTQAQPPAEAPAAEPPASQTGPAPDGEPGAA